jgi:hypothetical protein
MIHETFIETSSISEISSWGDISAQSSCFLCVNGAEHAVKLHGKCNEAHKELIRHHGMSPVATSAELYHVYCTCETPRR